MEGGGGFVSSGRRKGGGKLMQVSVQERGGLTLVFTSTDH